MRGAGPTDVREVAGLTGLAEEVLERLGRRGLVAKIVNGVPQYDSNPLVRAAQLLNEEQVRSHLVESAVRSAFDQLAQSGVLIVLQLHGPFKAGPDAYGLYLVVRQDFSGLDTPKGLVNKVRTHLEIASDTSGRGINQSKKLGVGASAVKTDGPPSTTTGSRTRRGRTAAPTGRTRPGPAPPAWSTTSTWRRTARTSRPRTSRPRRGSRSTWCTTARSRSWSTPAPSNPC
ncbi:hypothetical protein ACFQ0B_45855 [Nonomuraea thailandensis]